MMKSKQEMDSTDAIVSGSLKAVMLNTDATRQNGEVASVTNSSTEANRLPITLKSILKQAKNGSSSWGPATHGTTKKIRVVSALQPDKPFDRGKVLRSTHLNHKIVASMEVDVERDGESRTELDSHANMPVVRKEALIVEQSWKTVEASPFTPDYKPIMVEVVNAVVQYDSPLDGREYMLVIRNALCMPSMSNKLIPPFIMWENGIVVNECTKIRCEYPTREDHDTIFKGYVFCIPLQLHGTFSYFVTRKTGVESLEGVHEPLNYATEIYTLTPTRWNPHTDVYTLNEESIVDWEGNIKDKNHFDVKIVLDEIGNECQGQYKVSSMEAQYVDEILKVQSQQNTNNNLFRTSKLSTISSLLCPHLLTSMIEARLNLGSDAINIGAMNWYKESYLDDDAIVEDETPTTTDMIKDVMNELGSEEDMDAFFASSFHGALRSALMQKSYRRYGESHMRTPNAPLMQPPNMAHINLTP